MIKREFATTVGQIHDICSHRLDLTIPDTLQASVCYKKTKTGSVGLVETYLVFRTSRSMYTLL